MAQSAGEYRQYEWNNPNSYAIDYIYPNLVARLDPIRNRLILDLGCGNGDLAGRLLKQGFDVYGVDASESGIRIANQHFPGRFFLENLAQGSLPVELRDLRFDTIVSTEVIEHLYDPLAFLNFAHSILRQTQNSELFISTPYHGYLKNLLIAFSNGFDRHCEPLSTGGHIKFWSVRTLRYALQKTGFEMTGFSGCGRFPYCWKSMLIRAKTQG